MDPPPSLLTLTLLLLLASTAALAQDAVQSPADVGSTPSRVSAPSLLFSIPLLVLGLSLLLPFSRRFPRLTCPVALGNAFALAGWAGCVNLEGVGGVTGAGSTVWARDMAVWGITAGCWVVGMLIGLLPRYGLLAGWTFLGCEGGLALGFMVQMLADDLTIHSSAARWTVIGLLFVFGLISVVVTRSWGVIICTALTGSFLLMLGVDLLVNEDRGMSEGLAKLLDQNKHHRDALAQWDVPTTTIVFAAVSWAIALAGAILTHFTTRHLSPFLPTATAALLPLNSRLPATSSIDHRNGGHHHHHPHDRSISGTTPLHHPDHEGSGWRYDRQASTTPGADSAEMVELGAGSSSSQHPRGGGYLDASGRTAEPSESGLSAIAEQTERSRTDSAGRGSALPAGAAELAAGAAMAHHGHRRDDSRQTQGDSPVNSLYHRTYPMSYDPNTPTAMTFSHRSRPSHSSNRPSYDEDPSSSQSSHLPPLTARSPPGRSSHREGEGWSGFVDPDQPATPPLTLFSDTTIGPDDSASQVGWRRAQAEAQANYLAVGRRMEAERERERRGGGGRAEGVDDGESGEEELAGSGGGGEGAAMGGYGVEEPAERRRPLQVVNKTPQTSPPDSTNPAGLRQGFAVPTPSPGERTSTATPPTMRGAGRGFDGTPEPQQPTPTPTPPPATAAGKRTRFLGMPLIRIFSRSKRRGPSSAEDIEQQPSPESANTQKSQLAPPVNDAPPTAQPAAQPAQASPRRPLPPIPQPPSPNASQLRPPPPIYDSPRPGTDTGGAPSSFTAPTTSAYSKGVFSRLGHAFGRPPTNFGSPGGTGRDGMEGGERWEGRPERASTELTGPTAPMQGFFRSDAGEDGFGVRRDHEGWQGQAA